MRSYQDLPKYLAAFDAAILPFARNDATRFISPTKTLEYLAGGKPVVSTPIKDVVDLYGEVVELASTADEAVAAVERLWSEPDTSKAARFRRIRALLEEHDWDMIATQMDRLMQDTLRPRGSDAAYLIPPIVQAPSSLARAATPVREVTN
jgi:UDP-galactopyranose mutase